MKILSHSGALEDFCTSSTQLITHGIHDIPTLILLVGARSFLSNQDVYLKRGRERFFSTHPIDSETCELRKCLDEKTSSIQKGGKYWLEKAMLDMLD